MTFFVAILMSGLGCKKAQYADTGNPTVVASEDSALPEPTLDCANVNWDGWADGFFATYCRSCHSATSAARYGATESVNFDTRSDAIQWSERIRIRVIEQETMPLGGGVVRTDLEPLDLWLRCIEDTP